MKGNHAQDAGRRVTKERLCQLMNVRRALGDLGVDVTLTAADYDALFDDCSASEYGATTRDRKLVVISCNGPTHITRAGC